MSKLFDFSSLAMIPSAYKDGKLYSVRPTDGSGDFTFSRGSNLAATRVDVNGLIEKGRENLLPYSNDLNGSDWSATRLFSKTNGHSGYDGSNDAWLVIPNSSNNTHYINQVITSGNGVQTISVYAKAGGYDYFSIRDGSASDTYGRFDLATQTTSTDGSNAIESKMVSVGNDWYRCSLTLNRTAGGSNNLLFYVNNVYGNKPAYVGDEVSGVYFQDFQVEQGLVATDYIETGTSAAQSGILEDMPRLDYSGSCPSLLLEPQRSNYATQSEYIGGWIQSDITGVDNFAVSPEGVQNASKVSASLTPLIHFIQLAGGSVGNTATISLFAKADTGSYIQLTNPYSGAIFANFDVATGVVGTKGSSCISSDIEDYGNGWYRCIAVFDNTGFNSNIYRHYMVPSASALFGQSWLPTSDTSLFIYGHSWESGSYPTSYIPTYGTSQTRSDEFFYNYDNLQDLGILSSTWTFVYDQTFVDVPRDAACAVFLLDNGNNGDGSVSVRVALNSNGTFRLQDSEGNQDSSSDNKILCRYDGSKISWYGDGSLIDEHNVTGAFNTLDRHNPSGSNKKQIKLNQVLIFPTALTDSECIALTTL